MKKSFFPVLFLAGVFFLAGCTQSTVMIDDQNMKDDSENPLGITPSRPGEMTGDVDAMVGSGTVITTQKAGDTVSSPVLIEGETDAGFNSLMIELRDQNHNPKVAAYAVVKENDDGPNTFHVRLNFLFANTDEGFIAAYEKDGDEVKNLVEVPVKFETTK